MDADKHVRDFDAWVAGLTAKAERRGWILQRKPLPPYGWELLDEATRDPVRERTRLGDMPVFGSLEYIERYLDQGQHEEGTC
ncbi:hypothetical protein [Nocardia transvalensis]|uniref:hypothetical protein n=1 Tax=Nocardia transvalensis TaxID=37333 RepID=UPI001893EA5F|nr:hypothetical protein [Nocardia transvalensis]MBF6329864.1 hypothetical protein [Nocardia transvalensis]